MYPDLFKIGPLTLHSFGLMAMLGFLIPTLIMAGEFRRKGMNPELANNIAVAAIIGGFLGARLYYIIEHWQDFLKHPGEYIFSGAGLVWYGGFFGGALAVIWLMRHYQVPVWKAADVVGPHLLLGQAFGRLGCLLAADGDYGPPSDLPWAMAFPKGVVPIDVPVHPTPLYEMIFLLGFYALLWKIRRRAYPDGTFFGLYFIGAGIGRFITEFWRTTPKLLFDWMSLAQMISLGMIITGGLIIISRRRQKDELQSTASPLKQMAKNFIFFLLLPGFVIAQTAPPPAPRALQTEIQSGLACFCGCGMTIQGCLGGMICSESKTVSKEVAAHLQNGNGKPEVLQAMVAQYGERILAAPTKEGFNLTAWILPFVALAVGGLIVVKVISGWKKQMPAQTAAAVVPKAETAPADKYQDRFERELRESEK